MNHKKPLIITLTIEQRHLVTFLGLVALAKSYRDREKFKESLKIWVNIKILLENEPFFLTPKVVSVLKTEIKDTETQIKNMKKLIIKNSKIALMDEEKEE